MQIKCAAVFDLLPIFLSCILVLLFYLRLPCYLKGNLFHKILWRAMHTTGIINEVGTLNARQILQRKILGKLPCVWLCYVLPKQPEADDLGMEEMPASHITSLHQPLPPVLCDCICVRAWARPIARKKNIGGGVNEYSSGKHIYSFTILWMSYNVMQSLYKISFYKEG